MITFDGSPLVREFAGDGDDHLNLVVNFGLRTEPHHYYRIGPSIPRCFAYQKIFPLGLIEERIKSIDIGRLHANCKSRSTKLLSLGNRL
jgi:hypothetical protein